MYRMAGASLALMLAIATARAQGPERFENATAGIALSRPAGWHTASLQTVQDNRQRVQLSDAELQAAMQKYATAPLFVFMKYPEPHPTLNPSIQVTLRPSGPVTGASPVEILKLAVAALLKGFPDFTFVTPPEAVDVSGLPGAHMRGRYTVKNAEGGEYKVLARMWVVPRGAYLFLIGMSGPQDGPDVSEAEFAEALRSVSIQR